MELRRTEIGAGRAATPRRADRDNSERRLIPGEPGVVEVKERDNSTHLRKAMFNEFEIPFESYDKKKIEDDQEHLSVYDLAKGKRAKGYEAQHIIPVEMANHSVIQRIGMQMNHPSNGIFLPVPSDTSHSLSTHRGNHEVYSTAVELKLDEISRRLGPNASPREYEEAVYKLQSRLRTALENGTPMYKRKDDADGREYPGNKKAIWDRGGGATVDMWLKILSDV